MHLHVFVLAYSAPLMIMSTTFRHRKPLHFRNHRVPYHQLKHPDDRLASERGLFFDLVISLGQVPVSDSFIKLHLTRTCRASERLFFP